MQTRVKQTRFHWRFADDDIEAALGEDFGEGGLPVEGSGMDGRVADEAVALAVS